MFQKEQEQGPSEMPIVVVSITGRYLDQGFFSLREALSYIAAKQSNEWHIRASLEVGLGVSMTSIGNREYLRITLGRKEGVVPRSTSAHPDGIGVSTNYGTIFDIIIPVAAWEDIVFERGLSWVCASDPKKAYFDIVILPKHGLSYEELVRRYTQAQRTVMHRITALLNGQSSFPEQV